MTIVRDPFVVNIEQVTRVGPEEAIRSSVGDVYLVRSPNVSDLGDHYILVIGGLVDKPHGKRPETAVFPAPVQNPLDDYSDALVLLRLNPDARAAFYEHYGVDASHRIVQ